MPTFIQIYHVWEKGICEKYQSRDEKFPEPKGEGNLVSRLVFFANTPPKHDISV
jgi:hypothetical protein